MNPAHARPDATARPIARWPLLALLAAFIVAWIATLAGRSLAGPDEGRYAALSLAMLQNGDWVTPRLNGLLYFEKPPLQYWIGATSMALFGINEFAARLGPGLAGLVTVFLVGFTAWRLWGPTTGVHAFAIAGGTTWLVFNSHFLSLDATLTAALTLVLCGLALAERPASPPGARRRWLLAAWAGIGLAVLAKGLIGILIPLAVLTVHSVWRRDFGLWLRLHWLPGLAILALIVVPWFALVSARNPDFARFFFVHEHFERYLSSVHRREGAWWYFVPHLLVGLMPWTSALPWALRPRPADFATRFALVWVLFVFAFFSASHSKLPSYILPLFPALALLLARTLDQASIGALRWHLLVPTLFWGAALVGSTQVDRLASANTPQPAVDALARGIGVGAVLFLVGAALAWVLLRRQRITAALLSVAAAHFGAASIGLQAHDTYGQLKSSAAIARALAPLIDASTPVFAVRAYDQTLPFYLRRPVILVDYRDEFDLGQKREPERWIPTVDAFVVRWQAEPRAAAYLTSPTLAQLRQRGLAMRVVFEDPRRVVVVKP